MNYSVAGRKAQFESEDSDFYFILPWIHYNHGKPDEICLKQMWQDLNTKENLSNQKKWRVEISGPKRSNKSLEPNKLKRSDIHYERRQILLRYYPPFISSLDKLYKKLQDSSTGDISKLVKQIEQDWNVTIRYSSNSFGPLISFRQVRPDNCVNEIKLTALKHFHIDKQNSAKYIDVIEDIYPNIVVQINPFAPIENIFTQLGEIIDDYNIELHSLKTNTVSKQDFKKRVNSRAIRDRAARKLEDQRIFNKSTWYEIYKKKETKPQDLTILKLFCGNKSLHEIDSVIQKPYYDSEKNDPRRIPRRLKTIVEFCEKHKRNKSSFYKKCKKMTNKGHITLNDLKV